MTPLELLIEQDKKHQEELMAELLNKECYSDKEVKKPEDAQTDS